MDLELVRVSMVKVAAAAVHQSAAAMIADISTDTQEPQILALASELSDSILAFKFAEQSEQAAKAQPT